MAKIQGSRDAPGNCDFSWAKCFQTEEEWGILWE